MPALKPSDRDNLVGPCRAIARDVAAKYADDVDKQARFPRETIEALKQAKLLSAAVPTALGGHGANMQELTGMCTAIAQGCAASGMVLAMHHIQVACISRHGLASSYFKKYLTDLVEHQYVIASVTSEVGTWGDTRSSICAVERPASTPGRFKLDKDATTVSYGEHADALLVTCRRDSSAPKSDQILVLLKRGDYTLTPTSTWNTLGMRGTCSPGFRLASAAAEEQIVPGPFGDASAQTMVSYSHILWAGVWLGIASDAVARAGAFVRAEARKTPGTLPQQALRLAEVSTMLQTLRNNVAAQAAEFDAIMERPEGMDELLRMGWALKMNNIKVSASQAAPAIVHEALQITGIGGYKNDSRYSVGRNYRDSLSAALMISNDRIFAKNAPMLLVFKDE